MNDGCLVCEAVVHKENGFGSVHKFNCHLNRCFTAFGLSSALPGFGILHLECHNSSAGALETLGRVAESPDS